MRGVYARRKRCNASSELHPTLAQSDIQYNELLTAWRPFRSATWFAAAPESRCSV